MQYNQPFGITDPTAGYINGNPSTGTQGSIPPAASIEYPQREIVNLITDAGVATPSNSDLRQLGRAIQAGQLNYEPDTGTANAYAANLAPAPLAYVAGLFCVLKIANTNTGDSVLNLNSLGNKSIVHRDGSTMTAGELKSGGIYAFYYDGTNFQFVWSSSVSGSPVYLTAARTFYVNASTGNDTWDGTSATRGSGIVGPFATLQRAANEVVKYNLNGFNITVNVADGTYSSVTMNAVAGSGSVLWVGNVATPANVHVNVSLSNVAAIGVGGTTHNINGFKVTNPTGIGIGIGGNGVLVLGNIESGATQGPQFQCSYGSTLRFNGTAYRITGSAAGGGAAPGCWLWAYQGATVEVGNLGSPPSLTITGTPSWNFAFIYANMLSSAYITFSSITGSGTGTRYSATANSVIGGGSGNTTYFPGNAAGSTATGGQYL